MQILATIVPVFVVIFLGLFARKIGFITDVFIEHANRIVYYIAIPVMIFSSISKATLKTQLNLPVIAICLLSMIVCTIIVWGFSLYFKIRASQAGSFIQSSFHCNLGYIGLAMVFYYLDDDGFVRAAIIAGFMMILQNLMGVVVLQFHRNSKGSRLNGFDMLKKTMTNPVVLSALAGILFSLTGLKMPIIVDRSLEILKGMALPLALIIIGASLSFEKLKPRLRLALIAGLVKIMMLPAIGYVLFILFKIQLFDYLPGLILLASPTATIAYIMGTQMEGDPDLAAAAISISTTLSSLTYGIWMSVG
jgi:predicted permease